MFQACQDDGVAGGTRNLTRQRIIGAAVELLDAAGAGGLTFRALSAQLRTGPGAIYWHVANKDELLAAATDAVLAPALAVDAAAGTPEAAIRAIALGVFDAIDAHSWAGAQLATPSQPTLLRLFERVGRHLQALGVPVAGQFDAASAVVSYVHGVARQNAANARSGRNRAEFLQAESAGWASLDPGEFPFLRTVADQMRDHDDRRQFLAGLDLILAGIRQTVR
jgi:AcrR family transcriptional regulator